ncbi:UNVERIFIED_CONTAM: hypothetical protein FKN15_072491 [Acipenser sinensis]
MISGCSPAGREEPSQVKEETLFTEFSVLLTVTEQRREGGREGGRESESLPSVHTYPTSPPSSLQHDCTCAHKHHYIIITRSALGFTFC